MFTGFFFDYFYLLIGDFGGFDFYFVDSLLDSGRDGDWTGIANRIATGIGGGGDLDVVWKKSVDVIDYRADGFSQDAGVFDLFLDNRFVLRIKFIGAKAQGGDDGNAY